MSEDLNRIKKYVEHYIEHISEHAEKIKELSKEVKSEQLLIYFKDAVENIEKAINSLKELQDHL